MLVDVLRRSEHEPEHPLDVTDAVVALGKLKARDPDLPPILVNLLTRGKNALASFDDYAIELLGPQGASAEAAEPLLRGYLKVGDAWRRSTAAAALAQISRASAEEMVGFLISELEQGREEGLWPFVAERLASLGAIAAPAIPCPRGLRGSKKEKAAAAAAVEAIEAALAEQANKG